jgi:hypothetical protein
MMDTAEQELTLETFLTWKSDALKEYLSKRGLVKDKPKQKLAALAFAVHTMNLPLFQQDPFALFEGWLDEKAGLQQWPPIFFFYRTVTLVSISFCNSINLVMASPS